ncbi:MAG: heavy metal-associated domain-containing protein [Hyphomicrobiales bacterium]
MTDTPVKQSWKTLELDIGSMTCANCEVLIERRFKSLPGVVAVLADHTKGHVEIHYLGELDIPALQKVVEEDGYTVAPWHGDRAQDRAVNTLIGLH